MMNRGILLRPTSSAMRSSGGAQSEQTRALADRYIQIDEEASFDGADVAEIATKLGVLVLGR